MQEVRGRQDERAGANRRHAPRPGRHRTYAFDKGRISAGLLGLCATRHNQSIQTVPYVRVTVSRDELDSARCLDRSRGRGNDITQVAGFGSTEPWQPVFRIEKHIDGSAYIENITARPDQDADPAGPGDLLRWLTRDKCVHGAIFFHDGIRGNSVCVLI
jgi:hypothetical protein